MDKEIIEKYKKAGQIAKQTREFAKEFVKQEMKLFDIAEKIEGKIIELGAVPAFPVNLSLNEIAAHKTPVPDEETIAKGILKIDIGTCVDGYIGDTAIALDLTPNNEFKQIIELNKIILENTKKIINPNSEVQDIGKSISKTLHEFNLKNQTNFTIIHSLTGHGLDKDTIHSNPTIPNYSNSNSRKLNNTAFAIEPFITQGSGEIYEGEGGGIYILEKTSGNIRDPDARQILKYIIQEYKTKPFCERWLFKKEFKKIRFTLRELTKQKIIHHYPLLIEKTKSPVSQIEHTFLISDDLVICTTE